MKKLVLITIVFMMAAVVYATAGLQVTKPEAGETIYRATTNNYMIKWKKSGEVGKFVKIRLFDKTGTYKIYKIVDKVPETNEQFSWPKNMIKNTDIGDYVIKVTFTTDNSKYDLSGVFHIRDKPGLTIKMPEIYKKPVINIAKLKGFINVTSPASGAYKVNEPLTISWNKNFSNYSQVHIALYGSDNQMKDKIHVSTPNDGSATWLPLQKFSFPGMKYYIKVLTIDHKFEGKSGIFTIINAEATPTAQKKTIARTPDIKNNHTRDWNLANNNDCLSAPTPGMQGRAPGSSELKTGHHISEGKYKKCSWVLSYYFTSDMVFDLSEIKGKEIIRAELLLSLSDHIQVLPPETNSTCSSMSRIFDKNGLVTNFNILTPGDKTTINLLSSVKQWAVSGSGASYTLTVKDLRDSVNYISVCLKYYSQPILFIDYK